MDTRDKKIDAYIAKSADFAQPILIHIRDLVHKVCPEVEEKIKWGTPHFDYKGTFCFMAGFKQHCAFGFWKSSLMKESLARVQNAEDSTYGSFGKLKSLDDLPSDKILIACFKEAMKINDAGLKVIKKPKTTDKKELVVPDYFTKALSKNKTAKKVFEKFSYSHKKEYVEWITGAKAEDTRERRIAQALEMIAEGKGRNWKYEKK